MDTATDGEQLGLAKQNIGLAESADRFDIINRRASRKAFDQRLRASLPDLSLHSKHSGQHPSALSDCNNGATLIRAGTVRTHLFHRICKIGEADGFAPV
jgi:hypothetical protein